MKVRAKYQVAYKGKSYQGGDEFELSEKDLDDYKNDVIEVKTPDRTNPKTKASDMTKDQIMEELDKQGVEYSQSELKAELFDKLN